MNALFRSPVWVGVVCTLVGLCARSRADYPLPPVETGRLYVSGSGSDAVFCFSPAGELLFRFGHEDLRRPRGLAFRDRPGARELFVGSQATDRVLVFTPEGAFLRQLTADELDSPTSLAFAPDGKLYVASFSTDQVLVFDNEVYEGSIGAGELRGPNCIAFGPDGSVYVASQLTNEVVRFRSTGEVIGGFTGGGLSSPMGVAIWADSLWVTGGASDSVVRFSLDGEFLRSLSTMPAVRGPQGIAFDEHGRFATASFYTGRVVVFDRDAEIALQLPDAEISTARSVAWEPLRTARPRPFVRGDTNLDERVDISDPVAVLGFLFLGAALGTCPDASDSDDDGELRITDAIYSLTHLFAGGPPPPPPFPDSGEDPTTDRLECHDVAR